VILRRKVTLKHLCKHFTSWAGRTVAMYRSSIAGAEVISTAFGPTQPSSWGSNQMLFLPRPRWLWRHCSGRLALSRSSSCSSSTRQRAASLRAWPGGNLTGFTPFEFSTATKWLEILKEIAPGVTRVATVFNPAQSPQVKILRAIETVAPSFGVILTAAGVSDAVEIERAVGAFAHESNGGLIVVPNPVTISHRELIIALAAQHRLPVVYAYRYFVADGGLISYGPDFADQYRQAGRYVDRILKGERPADLPVQAPTKYELVINLKTARALGLTVPDRLLARADEVIE
jgi:ABC-type uncharacterized transport system substrate-binding protein